MKEFINRFDDKQTQYFTQGYTDLHPSETQQSLVDSKRNLSQKPKYTKHPALNLVSKLVRSTNAINIYSGGMFMPPQLNWDEDAIVEKINEQSRLAADAEEQLSEVYNERSLTPITSPVSATNRLDGKRQLSHLELLIAHKNATKAILNDDGPFHAEFFDMMYNPVSGYAYVDPRKLSEHQKNFGFGYSQDLVRLARISKISDKIASRWLRNNKNFVNWATLGEQMTAISVPDPRFPNRRVPKLVHHGSIQYISPVQGIGVRHMGTDLQVLSKLQPIEKEMELPGHVGTVPQAIDIVADKVGIKLDGGAIEHNPEDIQKMLYNHPSPSIPYEAKFKGNEGLTSKDAKFYSGFVKMNNPLRMDDVQVWTMDNVLSELLLMGELHLDASKGWTYDIDADGALEGWENNMTPFRKLVNYFGQGTAMEQILLYAREKYENDMNNAGIELSNWNEEWDDFLPIQKAEIHYYKTQGLMEFINKDLGYDGIVYKNTAEGVRQLEGEDLEEDPNTGEPVFNPEIYEDSYILFHPFQFKSIYNTGEFNPAVKNFLGKYSKRKNKYQKVA